MAHDIARINGKDAVFTVGQPAWHHLGDTLPNTVKWAEAMKAAQLDWTVSKHNIFVRRPVTKDVFQLPDVVSVHRSNDGAYLGTVGTGYELVQNEEMFLYVDDLLQAEDGAHYETAGALGNGAQLWALARLPHVSRIRGTEDTTSNYLMFFGAHDGSSRNIVKLVRERVVCRNTLNVALGEAGKALSFKHTKNVRFKMAEAKKIWLGIHQDIQNQDERENLLATRRMTRESMTAVLNRLFPENKQADSQAKREGILTSVLSLYEDNDNNAIPEIKGTAYNLLNAVTQYSDHFRPVRITQGRQGMTEGQVRAENALFGTGDALKQGAVTAVLEETRNNPVQLEGKPSKGSEFVSDGAFLKSLGIRG